MPSLQLYFASTSVWKALPLKNAESGERLKSIFLYISEKSSIICSIRYNTMYSYIHT